MRTADAELGVVAVVAAEPIGAQADDFLAIIAAHSSRSS